jgi:large subunit ribosomal protein L2
MIALYSIKALEKKFIKGLKKSGGRCHTGRVTVRGQGGGNKVNYRALDLHRRLNQYGLLMRISYDPCRTSKLGLILFENSVCCLILAQKNMKVKSIIYLGSGSLYEGDEIKNGYSMPLLNMPLFSVLSNIEFKPFKGGGLCRASDTSSMLVGKSKGRGVLKLNSN